MLGLDFGAVEDGESERDEEIFELPLNLRDGMQAAGAHAGRGRGEVDPFGFEAGVKRVRFERGFARRRCCDSNSCLTALSSLPMLGALFRRELAELPC